MHAIYSIKSSIGHNVNGAKEKPPLCVRRSIHALVAQKGGS